MPNDTGSSIGADLLGWLRDRGVTLDAVCAERAQACVAHWRRHQRALNIVSVGRLGLQLEACIASAEALSQFDREGAVVDVGAGGGFPGLWLAACSSRPGLLVEPRAKRADFLELVLRAMGRDDWAVLRARWEQGIWRGMDGRACDLAAMAGGTVAVASARAVWDVGTWWPIGLAMVGPTGAVMTHVRPGDANPAGTRELAQVCRGDWSVRLLAGAPGEDAG